MLNLADVPLTHPITTLTALLAAVVGLMLLARFPHAQTTNAQAAHIAGGCALIAVCGTILYVAAGGPLVTTP